MKGFKVNDNEYIIFDTINNDVLDSLVKKYGKPIEYPCKYKNYGVYKDHNITFIVLDDKVTMETISEAFMKNNRITQGGRKEKAHWDPYTYEGKASR